MDSRKSAKAGLPQAPGPKPACPSYNEIQPSGSCVGGGMAEADARQLAWVDMVMRRLAQVEQENGRLQARCTQLENALRQALSVVAITEPFMSEDGSALLMLRL